MKAQSSSKKRWNPLGLLLETGTMSPPPNFIDQKETKVQLRTEWKESCPLDREKKKEACTRRHVYTGREGINSLGMR